MKDLIIRFAIGGFVVSLFAIISDLFRPKTFAGLFGAAPSIALASLALTVATEGKSVASIEARSMIVGAVAFLIYAFNLSWIALRFKLAALRVFLPGLLIWLGAAVGLWYVALGH